MDRYWRETLVKERVKQEKLESKRRELYDQPKRLISPLRSAEFFQRQQSWDDNRLRKLEEERLLRNDVAEIRTRSAHISPSPVSRIMDESVMSQSEFEDQCRQLADPEAFQREREAKATATEMFLARQRQFLAQREKKLQEERDKAEARFASPHQQRRAVAVPDFIDGGFMQTDVHQRQQAFLIKRDARIDQLRKEVYHELEKAKKRLTEDEYVEMYRRSVNWLAKREEALNKLRKEQEEREREERKMQSPSTSMRRPSSASSQRGRSSADGDSQSSPSKSSAPVVSESVVKRMEDSTAKFQERLEEGRQKAQELPPKEVRQIIDFGPPLPRSTILTPRSNGNGLLNTSLHQQGEYSHSVSMTQSSSLTPRSYAQLAQQTAPPQQTSTPRSTSVLDTTATSQQLGSSQTSSQQQPGSSTLERRASIGSVQSSSGGGVDAFLDRVKGKYAERLNESTASVNSWMPITTKTEPFRLETEQRALTRAPSPKVTRPAASPAKSYIAKLVVDLDETQSPLKQHALVNFLQRMSKVHDVRHSREVEEEARQRGEGWSRTATVPTPFKFNTDERASVRKASPARARTPSSAETTISQLVTQLTARRSRPTSATPASRQSSVSPRRHTSSQQQTPSSSSRTPNSILHASSSRAPSPGRSHPLDSTTLAKSVTIMTGSAGERPAEDVRRAVERLREVGASLRPTSPGE